MPKCSYCGKEYGLHKGVTYVQNDGTIVYLCGSKCRKNRIMKRRNVIWAQYNKTIGDGGRLKPVKRDDSKK